MPVGRFVLDVHGESRSTWPANDALCAALQVINHLQDCGQDYRDLDRVYIPLDAFAAAAPQAASLGQPRATPASGLHRRPCDPHRSCCGKSSPFAYLIQDARPGLEVSVIQTLAESG